MALLHRQLLDNLKKHLFTLYPDTDFSQRIMLCAPCHGNNLYCSFKNIALDTYSGIALNSCIHNTKIGRYCSIGSKVHTGAPAQNVRLEKNAISLQNTQDFAFAGYNNSPSSPTPLANFVDIGHDVWIGDKAVICENVKIGNGAVIGAGAVITKDVPPYAIMIGKDKLLRYRFSDEIISDLIESHWWDYDLPEMWRHGIKFPFDQPELLLQTFKDLDQEQLIPAQDYWISFDIPEEIQESSLDNDSNKHKSAHECSRILTKIQIKLINRAQAYSFFDCLNPSQES